MAIDMISEPPSLATSPRISFSHDLCHEDDDVISEFDFCISDSTNTETSSADELFSDGLIRPIQLQEKYYVTYSKQIPLSKNHNNTVIPQVRSWEDEMYADPRLKKTIFENCLVDSFAPLIPVSQHETSKQEILKPNVSTTEQQKNQSNSFWSMKKSSSVHCVNTHKKSSFWSLPLLSRSNSTGSVSNSKQTGQKQSSQLKQMKNNAAPASFYTFPSSQKPPLRKSYGSSGHNYGAGIRINPVLNVTPPCISKGTANLFGLGSLFRNGKDKKSKK